jgi:hypothetical protein
MQRALTVVETTVPAIPSGTWALILNTETMQTLSEVICCAVSPRYAAH